MTPEMIRRAVAIIAPRSMEVSARPPEAVRDFALAGVNVISIGALTHSATAVDLVSTSCRLARHAVDCVISFAPTASSLIWFGRLGVRAAGGETRF
jgi:hypothetical protein